MESTSTPNLTPIPFNDFRPGIADRPGVNYPAEQATRENTYRCYALPSGALVPAPRHTYSRAGQHFEGSNPSASLGYSVSGICAVGPVIPGGGPTFSDAQHAHELWIATEWALSTPTKKRRLQRVKLDENPVATEDIITQSDASASEATFASPCLFAQTRSNKTTPTQVGIPVVVIAWGSTISGFGNVWEFPDDAAPTTSTPYVILATTSAFITAHQGRIVIAQIVNYAHGVNTVFSTGENLKWTDVNDMTAANVSIEQAFWPEASDGYSCIASMTANELLLIKESGAIVVFGDLDNPTVNNLPSVVGNAEFFLCYGVRTSLGFLYPAKGVYLWASGSNSQLLTPMMDPDFYKPDAGQLAIPFASWYASNNFIFLSNNFFIDVPTKAVWQIDNPSDIQFAYATGARSQVYLSKNFYTNASDALIRGYDLSLGATSYSWQSHPLWESIDRVIEVRSVELIAEGQGTVSISFTDMSNTPSTPLVITLDNTGFPERFRRDIKVQGRYMQLRIEADSGTTDDDAPTVHLVKPHIMPTTREPSS